MVAGEDGFSSKAKQGIFGVASETLDQKEGGEGEGRAGPCAKTSAAQGRGKSRAKVTSRKKKKMKTFIEKEKTCKKNLTPRSRRRKEGEEAPALTPKGERGNGHSSGEEKRRGCATSSHRSETSKGGERPTNRTSLVGGRKGSAVQTWSRKEKGDTNRKRHEES